MQPATADFSRDKTACVIGGGDTAVEDALYLANLCKKVYIIHRRDAFRAARSNAEKLYKNDKIEIIFDTVPEKISGGDFVEKLRVKNVKTGKVRDILTDAVFGCGRHRADKFSYRRHAQNRRKRIYHSRPQYAHVTARNLRGGRHLPKTAQTDNHGVCGRRGGSDCGGGGHYGVNAQKHCDYLYKLTKI